MGMLSNATSLFALLWMGFVVEPDGADDPWIRAIIERYEWLKGRPDIGVGYWTQAEWHDLEHLHQQHHRQQQQQEQQLRQQQHQQRQILFQYRQQQQQQYHLQQQHENYRRRPHQQHYQQEIAKKTSKAQQVEARADRGGAPAKKSGAPPSSQTTLKPQSLCEYPAMILFASQPVCRKVLSTNDDQLESMENGLLRKPAQTFEEEKLEELVEEPERPQHLMHVAQPRPCSPAEGVGGDEMGVLGKELVVAGGLVDADGGAGVEKQRHPFWEDGKISVWWPAPDETELEMGSSYAQMRLPAVSSNNTFGGRDVDDGNVVVGDGSLVLEDGEQAPPPLLQQQQQELPAPTPQEPWPPPMAAEHGGSGAGSCGESRLGLEGFSTARLDFSFGDGLGGLGGGNWESYTADRRAWERAGIGTGARSRAFWGCEGAGRRLTQLRRERVREK